jgi:cell migration-inducing and hyaluronan-binding protein
MSKNNRSFVLFSLIPAFLMFSVFAVLGTEEASAQTSAARSGAWSDPDTWANRKVPVAGDKVTIARDQDVVLDVSPPALAGVSVDGKLRFSNDTDLELTTEWIMVHGELEIGTEARPHTSNVTITFTDNVKGEDMMAGMGDRGIMLSGGTLNLHGNRTHTWTKLSSTAEAGSTTIEVLDASEWQVGDQIVLASTDFESRQAEERTITAIRGATITLDQPLDYMHYGRITFDVDERGEVVNLTRNIKIQASEDAEESFFGGHIMAMPGSHMYVEGVELYRMGQNLTLARYPIHWHLVGDAEGQYIKNAAIHDTYNRCVTVHGTNYLRVENNVTYNNVGHCFFLEDGIEHGNEFIANVGIQTKCHTSKPCAPTNLAASGSEYASDNSGQTNGDALIPSDNSVSTFWITNPDNVYRDNVAAGSDQIGFWMAFSAHPTGQFEGTEISLNTWPRRTQIREFNGNVAHSNVDGLILDRGQDAQGRFNVGGNPHAAFADPANPNGDPPIESYIRNFTAYKSRNGGIWGRGEMHVYEGLVLADNANGFTNAYPGIEPQGGEFTSKVVDSLFVGETDNIGNPTKPTEIAYGRSLPYPSLPDYPIRGFEFYDFLHHVEDSKFVNYEDNDTREAGAFSYLLFTSFPTSIDNSIENIEFVNAKPAHFPEMKLEWGSDSGGGGYRTAGFTDLDGSLGFGANAYVVNDIGILSGVEGCDAQPSWDAVVCTGDIGRMNVGNAGGGRGGFGGFGGGRGGRGGAAAPAQPPVVLSSNGVEFTATGETGIVAGAEVSVATERDELSISLSQLDNGSWVIFELPGFSTAAAGEEKNSLNALRDSSDTAYYKDDGTLWVKLVVANNNAGAGAGGGRGGRGGGFGGGAGTSIQVNR